MIIHFAGSTQDLKNDLVYYKKIISTIHAEGAALALDWLDSFILQKQKNSEYSPDWSEVMEDTHEAIKRADLVVIEATAYGLSQGYQVGFALKHKKPTLLLSRKSFQGNMGFGIRSKFFSIGTYDNENALVDILKRFIEQNDVSLKDLRFNFFINRDIYQYLRQISYETGKNKSEIIRQVIEREMERED